MSNPEDSNWVGWHGCLARGFELWGKARLFVHTIHMDETPVLPDLSFTVFGFNLYVKIKYLTVEEAIFLY